MPSETEISTFLSDPASYPERPVRVDVIETHAARVFLAGTHAIKVKKHVRLPYLDFTTLAQREMVLRRELELNQPAAPDIYLGLKRITRDGGRLTFDGKGETIEVALNMRRFAQEDLLSHAAAEGRIDQALAKAIADVAFVAHEAAPVVTNGDGVERFTHIISDIETALESCSEPQMRADRTPFADLARKHLARVQPLLAARARVGFRRRCHGDLHLGNMVLWHGQPLPFDALEFDEELATIDILYDLAFLIMDLDHRNLRPRANDVLNRYLWRADVRNLDGLAALPLFLALRAGIRAMVDLHRIAGADSTTPPHVLDDARHYLDHGLRHLAPASPSLVAVGGLSGSGKSTLAARLASAIDISPGAIHLRSDLERKRLFGVGETDRLPEEAYARDVTEKVYAILNAKAATVLATGYSVIVDAVHSALHERAAVEHIAEIANVPFTGLWLNAPGRILKDRVTARKSDASDATADVVARQLDYDLGNVSWHQLDASGALDALCENARDLIAASFGAPARKEPRP